MAFIDVFLAPDLEPSAFDAHSLLSLHLGHILRVLGVYLETVECLLLNARCQVIKNSQFLCLHESLLSSLDLEACTESQILLPFKVDRGCFEHAFGLRF